MEQAKYTELTYLALCSSGHDTKNHSTRKRLPFCLYLDYQPLVQSDLHCANTPKEKEDTRRIDSDRTQVQCLQRLSKTKVLKDGSNSGGDGNFKGVIVSCMPHLGVQLELYRSDHSAVTATLVVMGFLFALRRYRVPSQTLHPKGLMTVNESYRCSRDVLASNQSRASAQRPSLQSGTLIRQYSRLILTKGSPEVTMHLWHRHEPRAAQHNVACAYSEPAKKNTPVANVKCRAVGGYCVRDGCGLSPGVLKVRWMERRDSIKTASTTRYATLSCVGMITTLAPDPHTSQISQSRSKVTQRDAAIPMGLNIIKPQYRMTTTNRRELCQPEKDREPAVPRQYVTANLTEKRFEFKLFTCSAAASRSTAVAPNAITTWVGRGLDPSGQQ
ncbi:hypothetical protein F5148DRAFT_1326152 [Russula earlei]|uniref:Uncharacterized protein n=1 Tax=Russula earlei TaxID=71964 RepID=A0ACC0TZI9_9AGAM|nr:hypothetical protein F5148DRAFT_1326152 [Russula earlei]